MNPTDSHSLDDSWVFWYIHRNPGAKGAQINYEDSIKEVSTVSTVEEFWAVYSHLKRPSDAPCITDYHIFKQGIKPMWEDEKNLQGGKVIVRLRKGISTRMWERLLIALLAREFQHLDNISGLVLSVRFHEDILSIWNKTADDHAVIETLKSDMINLLGLPDGTIIEYKPHDLSIKDQTSFNKK